MPSIMAGEKHEKGRSFGGVAVLVVAVAAMVFASFAPSYLRAGMTRQATSWPLAGGEYTPLRMVPGTVLKVHLAAPESLRDIEAIELVFGTWTYERDMSIASLELRDESGGCVFAAVPGAALLDNQPIRLTRQGCDAPGTSFALELKTRDGRPAALWAIEGEAPRSGSGPVFRVLLGDGRVLAPVGGYLLRVASEPPVLARWELLSRMWGMEPGMIASGLGLSLGLLALGLALLVLALRLERRAVLVLGVGVTALALGAINAATVPPYQAPDEAIHMLVAARHFGPSSWETEALTLARASHYNRLMCRTREKFTVADSLQLSTDGWPSRFRLYDVNYRSALLPGYWQALTAIFHDAPLNIALLGYRLVDALLIAIAAATACALVALQSGGSQPGALFRSSSGLVAVLPLFVVPTLWFFGMHVSNHVFLIVAYIVLAMMPRLLAEKEPPRATYIAWGAATGMAILAGRAGLLAAVVAFCLMGYRVIETAIRHGAHWETWRGEAARLAWGAGILAALLLAGLSTDYFKHQSPELSLLLASHASVAIGAAIVFIAGAALVVLCVRIPHVGRAASSLLLRGLFILGITTTIGLFFLPKVYTPPVIPNIEVSDRIGAATYVVLVLKAFLGSWGIGGREWLLVGSFWGGYGCPEPVVSNTVVRTLHVSMLAAFGLGMLGAYRRRDLGDLCRSIFVLALSLAYLAMLAWSSAAAQNQGNLHGRYLIGFYLLLFCYAWSSALDEILRRVVTMPYRRHITTIIPIVTVAMIVGVHAVTMRNVLGRYF